MRLVENHEFFLLLFYEISCSESLSLNLNSCNRETLKYSYRPPACCRDQKQSEIGNFNLERLISMSNVGAFKFKSFN